MARYSERLDARPIAVAGASAWATGEIARLASRTTEADLDGTLVVQVGTELGAWSNDIGADRLAELVAAAQRDKSGVSRAFFVESAASSGARGLGAALGLDRARDAWFARSWRFSPSIS